VYRGSASWAPAELPTISWLSDLLGTIVATTFGDAGVCASERATRQGCSALLRAASHVGRAVLG
jgi:hypothetical protein